MLFDVRSWTHALGLRATGRCATSYGEARPLPPCRNRSHGRVSPPISLRYIFLRGGYGRVEGCRQSLRASPAQRYVQPPAVKPYRHRGLQGGHAIGWHTCTARVRQCLATGGLTKRYRPPAQGLPEVHGRRCGAPGRDRRPPRHALGTRHPALAAARFVGLRGHPHCAAGVDLGGASLPPAGRRRLPGTPPTGDQDAPHRHRSGSAVGDRGHLRAALRGLPAAGDQGHARRLPLHDQRLPCRQRLRSTSTTRSPAGWRSRIEVTKSRPRHSNDNGLAETKNGAVVRKCFGDSHPQRYAMQINAFCAAYLNPQLPPTLPVRRGH